MKVLLLGGGGREHAIAWKLAQDDPALDLVVVPGNPGIAELGRCVAGDPGDVAVMAAVADAERPDLVVIGPEGPLDAGVSDVLSARGYRVFGPGREAARLEASKRFAKEVMLAAGVPTAGATWHTDVDSARAAIRRLGAPVVIKASGLAAGKGVVVAQSIDEADRAVERMLLQHAFGTAGGEILVEEFMQGEELSVFAVTDGDDFVLLLPAQDHKRLLEGDEGPNTGGMGAYAPVAIATPSVLAEAAERVIAPTLHAMRERGTPFRGLLYAGLMLTEAGMKVVEFNCRFGDPETQALLPLLESSLLDLVLRAATPGGMRGVAPPRWRPGACVTTVVATPGYPDAPVTGAAVTLPGAHPGVTVFHAGTKRGPDGVLRTSGGRVFAVSATGRDIAEARERSAAAAAAIDFPDRHLRRDIAWREMARSAGAP